MENRSAGIQLLILCFLFIVCLFVSNFLSVLVLVPSYGAKALFDLPSILTHLLNNPADGNNALLLKFMQLINALGSFLVPPLILARISGKSLSAYFNNKKPAKIFLTLFVTFLIVMGSLPLVGFLGEINAHLNLPSSLDWLETWMRQTEDQATDLTNAFLKVNGGLDIFLNVIIIALIPAIGEELLFRGAFQKLFFQLTKNAHTGIWLAAALFSAIHFQFYGFLPRMVLGAMLGYLFYWTGSLWVPIWAHFINNAMALLLAYLSQKGIISEEIENIGTTNNQYAYIVVSCIVVGLLFSWTYKNRSKEIILNEG